MATLDVLGEDVTRREETEQTVRDYQQALAEIAARGLDSNISVKLTALGLKLDPPIAAQQFARIVEAARAHGNFVRIDMEDSSVTEETIRIFLEFREAYERKSGSSCRPTSAAAPTDAQRAAAASTANVRVCKGIYVEPPEIAFQDREEIRASYMAIVERLLRREVLRRHRHARSGPRRARARARSRRLRLPREAYEFQMLLGVAGELRRRLVAAGPPPARLRALRGGLVRLLGPAAQGKPVDRGPRSCRASFRAGPADRRSTGFPGRARRFPGSEVSLRGRKHLRNREFGSRSPTEESRHGGN